MSFLVSFFDFKNLLRVCCFHFYYVFAIIHSLFLLLCIAELRYVIALPMASIEYSSVENLASSTTSSSLLQHLLRDLLDTEIFRITTSNERIALFDSPNRDLVDAQCGRNLVFFLK